MRDIRILTFHGIGRPQRQLEPNEAPFWVSTDRFVSILDRIVAHPDRASIAITFDDSNSSDLSIAVPHLLRRGLRGAFFVLTGRLGQPGSLSGADVREIIACGMAVGSHGVTHRDWTSLDGPRLQHELVASRTALGEICRQPIEAAAIPFGRYNSMTIQALRAAGYRIAYSSDRGAVNPQAFLRPRTSIRSDTSNAELERILAGSLSPLRRIRRLVSMQIKALA